MRILLLLLLSSSLVASHYIIGTGMADITGKKRNKKKKTTVHLIISIGPVAEIIMMGYAMLHQISAGLHQRLWSRAFIVVDEDKRIVFVNTDTLAASDVIKARVVAKLTEIYGTLYTDENFVFSSTHSHSGPGGYLQHGTLNREFLHLTFAA